MWRQCHTCGWWQQGRRSCKGCSHSSLRSTRPSHGASKPQPRNVAEPPTFTVLQDRWHQAKQSSQNPKHVKIEKFCCQCLLRTLGGSSTCRGCRGDLTSGMKILPGQWPPLNCPDHLLQRFEPTGSAPVSAAVTVGTTGDVQMMGGDSPDTDRPLQHLPLAQLRQEKLKLEKHILELPNDGFSNLREQLELTLSATVREINQRKPAGQSLDQALSRHKAAVKAKAAAEEHLHQAEAAVARAQQALQNARDTEAQTAQDVSRVRASIADEDGCELIRTPQVPAPVISGVFQILQNAGLSPTQLAAVAQVTGSPLPPAPPAAPMPAGTPLPTGTAAAKAPLPPAPMPQPPQVEQACPRSAADFCTEDYRQRDRRTATGPYPSASCSASFTTCRWLPTRPDCRWPAQTQGPISSPASKTSSTRRGSRLCFYLQRGVFSLASGLPNPGPRPILPRGLAHSAHGSATAAGHQPSWCSPGAVGGLRVGGGASHPLDVALHCATKQPTPHPLPDVSARFGKVGCLRFSLCFGGMSQVISCSSEFPLSHMDAYSASGVASGISDVSLPVMWKLLATSIVHSLTCIGQSQAVSAPDISLSGVDFSFWNLPPEMSRRSISRAVTTASMPSVPNHPITVLVLYNLRWLLG